MNKNNKPSSFLDSVRIAIRLRHYSIRTEQAYIQWTKRFILFHDKRHPKDMAEHEVVEILTYLAISQNVAANTQNQALNALNFLYKNVLQKPLSELTGVARAKKKQKIPIVLTPTEIRKILKNLAGSFSFFIAFKLLPQIVMGRDAFPLHQNLNRHQLIVRTATVRHLYIFVLIEYNLYGA